jgi:hypothetical protein
VCHILNLVLSVELDPSDDVRDLHTLAHNKAPEARAQALALIQPYGILEPQIVLLLDDTTLLGKHLVIPAQLLHPDPEVLYPIYQALQHNA